MHATRWLWTWLAVLGWVSSTSADDLPAALQESLKDGGTAPALVLISPGRFVMGSPEDEPGRSEDEGPQTTLVIDSAFYMGRTEITVEAFSHFVTVTGYEPDSRTNGCYVWREGKLTTERETSWSNLPGYASGANHPAVCVSWRDALRYTEWLSAQTGAHYRLPTEIEWEYAARAGSSSARYWGGDPDLACKHANVADLSFYARYVALSREIHGCRDGFPQNAPVASFASNQFGLHDMLGNVWEWTCSVFGSLKSRAAFECVDFWTPGPRVLRGGGWFIPPAGVRSAHRNAGSSGSQSVSIGFRVVREL